MPTVADLGIELALPTKEEYADLSEEEKDQVDSIVDDLFVNFSEVLKDSGDPEAIEAARFIDDLLTLSDEEVAKMSNIQ